MIRVFRDMFKRKGHAFADPVSSAIVKATEANKAVAAEADAAIQRLIEKLRKREQEELKQKDTV
jgi:hypothetical protein